VKRFAVCALAAMSCLGVAYAEENQSFDCRHDNDERTVAVEYSMDGGTRSCSVLYKKVASSSEPARELWHYQAHADMCDVQAQQFLKKLESFGLTCSAPDKTHAER
jgi:hypothetical protein